MNEEIMTNVEETFNEETETNNNQVFDLVPEEDYEETNETNLAPLLVGVFVAGAVAARVAKPVFCKIKNKVTEKINQRKLKKAYVDDVPNGEIIDIEPEENREENTTEKTTKSNKK